MAKELPIPYKTGKYVMFMDPEVYGNKERKTAYIMGVVAARSTNPDKYNARRLEKNLPYADFHKGYEETKLLYGGKKIKKTPQNEETKRRAPRCPDFRKPRANEPDCYEMMQRHRNDSSSLDKYVWEDGAVVGFTDEYL